MFWSFLGRSARVATIKAVRGTVAIKGVSTIKRAVRSPYGGGSVPLTGPSVPLRGGSVPLTGLF